MGNVVSGDFGGGDGKYAVDYITTPEGEVVGVSHPDWNFQITRSDDGKQIALVSDDGDAFGVLDADVFNTVLMSWLLIDDPKLIDAAAESE